MTVARANARLPQFCFVDVTEPMMTLEPISKSAICCSSNMKAKNDSRAPRYVWQAGYDVDILYMIFTRNLQPFATTKPVNMSLQDLFGLEPRQSEEDHCFFGGDFHPHGDKKVQKMSNQPQCIFEGNVDFPPQQQVVCVSAQALQHPQPYKLRVA